MKRLTIRAHVGAYAGYHVLLGEVFKWLTARGIFVSIRPIAVDEQWGRAAAIPTAMRGQIVNSRQPEDYEILMAPPDQDPTPGRKTIYFTMYESTEMPPQYVSNLNRSELVIVPCKWCAESFRENGVNVPIEVVSLGYDPKVFRPTPVASNGPTIFGVAGRTKHCERRKAVQESIDLFLQTFPKDEDVRLHVKVHPDDNAKSNDHRVKIIKSHFEPYELAQWISNLTCYLTLSRGEGFGLWPLQAMASGRPVIGVKYSGQADFMAESNAFIVPHRVVDAVSGESNVEYLGQWAEPNKKVAAQLMQTIRKNRLRAANVGEAAAESSKALTWEACTDKLISIFQRVGALDCNPGITEGEVLK